MRSVPDDIRQMRAIKNPSCNSCTRSLAVCAGAFFKAIQATRTHSHTRARALNNPLWIGGSAAARDSTVQGHAGDAEHQEAAFQAHKTVRGDEARRAEAARAPWSNSTVAGKECRLESAPAGGGASGLAPTVAVEREQDWVLRRRQGVGVRPWPQEPKAVPSTRRSGQSELGAPGKLRHAGGGGQPRRSGAQCAARRIATGCGDVGCGDASHQAPPHQKQHPQADDEVDRGWGRSADSNLVFVRVWRATQQAWLLASAEDWRRGLLEARGRGDGVRRHASRLQALQTPLVVHQSREFGAAQRKALPRACQAAG